MALKRFLVGPKSDGERSDLKSFFLPENSYETLENVYIYKGRVKKKFGCSLIGNSALSSKVCLNVGKTDENGDFLVTVPGSVFEKGQCFSVEEDIFTINKTGTLESLLSTNVDAFGEINTTTGEVFFTECTPNTDIYFYPNQPIMGIFQRPQDNSYLQETIYFDTQFSYYKEAATFERLGTKTWTGENYNFFWGCNYRGANPYDNCFYVTNFNPDDNICYIGSASTDDWQTLRPQLDSDSTRYLETALILVSFKDRLVALNTIESNGNTNQKYVNRCRFCQNGDPTDTTNGWIDTISGKGGYIDAPTSDSIVSAATIKDRLIVYFKNSTWELFYTGNFTMPFRWQKINSDLGSSSSFSTIPFDSHVLTVGAEAITACDGINVVRIDKKNPEYVFSVNREDSGQTRVFGIRDFFNECVYWNYSKGTEFCSFPTNIFLYNYQNKTWANFENSFTCFGYADAIDNTTWENLPYDSWEEWNTPWDSPTLKYGFSQVIAGNQQGFIFVLDNDRSSNDESLYIFNIDFDPNYRPYLEIKNHNLKVGDYIKITQAQGCTNFNEQVFKVVDVKNEDFIFFDGEVPDGIYTGGGFVAKIDNIKILTNQFNLGSNIGKSFRFLYIDFLFNKTLNGELCVDYFLDTNGLSSIQEQAEEGVLLGSNVVFTKPEENQLFQEDQNQIWHRYFLNAQGKFIQLKFFLNDEQLRNLDIVNSALEMHGFVFCAEAQGDLL